MRNLLQQKSKKGKGKNNMSKNLHTNKKEEIPKHQNREWLFKKYWEEELSFREIGKICEKSHQTIWKQFRKFKIPSRIIGGRKGEKHPFYGKHFTRKHREKISKALKGIKPSKETREKMREAKLGNKHPRWKGQYVDDSGYIRILKPEHPFANGDGYILEQRLIAEMALKRYLRPWERVGRWDGNKSNNSWDNLFVFQTEARR